MKRETRHELNALAEELRSVCARLGEVRREEPNEEALDLLAEANKCCAEAVYALVSATEIGDDPAAISAQSVKRGRKPRAAPEDEEAPPGQLRIDEPGE